MGVTLLPPKSSLPNPFVITYIPTTSQMNATAGRINNKNRMQQNMRKMSSIDNSDSYYQQQQHMHAHQHGNAINFSMNDGNQHQSIPERKVTQAAKVGKATG